MMRGSALGTSTCSFIGEEEEGAIEGTRCCRDVEESTRKRTRHMYFKSGKEERPHTDICRELYMN